jgi:hypothetical protein
VWKPLKGKKVEVAMKILKPECGDKYMKVMNGLFGVHITKLQASRSQQNHTMLQ